MTLRHQREAATRPPAVSNSSIVVGAADVTKEFAARGRRVTALEGVDIAVRDGEFVTVVGASGCGKSTLLKLMAGLMKPTAGTVNRAESVAVRGGTGMVFQSAVLLPWRTVLDNVLLPIEMIHVPNGEDKARELLQHVGLGGFEKVLPHQLSGGMQQRVAICRALVTNPRLLLMDEPFGALDAITREQMNLLLQRVWLEIRNSVVLVTHSISEAVFLSDRIVVMTPRPGRVAEVIENPLPRPRGAATYRDDRFGEYTNHIRDVIALWGEAA